MGRLLAVGVVAVGLAAACGSFSEQPRSPDPDAAGTVDAASDARSSDAGAYRDADAEGDTSRPSSPGVVACGADNCAVGGGSVCCGAWGDDPQCVTPEAGVDRPGGPCSGAPEFHCDEPADCARHPDRPRCCLSADGLSSVCQVSCVNTLCVGPSDCSGGPCQAVICGGRALALCATAAGGLPAGCETTTN